MNNLDEQKSKAVLRDLYYLKDLLKGIQTNEGNISNPLIKRLVKMHEGYANGVTISISDKTIYRHVSIEALTQYFNRNTSYFIEVNDTLLNHWFADYSTCEEKRKLITSDVLIIHGRSFGANIDSFERVLLEVIETRKSENKVTWIFFENPTESDLCKMIKTDFEGIVKNIYTYTNF
jgi:hypothetical protein